MINNALKLVRNELGFYIEQNSSVPDAKVVLGNIGLAESDSDKLEKGVVISLVNVEEERTLKNVQNYTKSPTTGKIEYHNAPVNLNLYVLFTAYTDTYVNSLALLSLTIRFFQGQSIFTASNTVSTTSNDNLNDIKLIFNIYTTTFEQLNHLWGSLGGKQMPHILYRVWLVEEKDQKPLQTGGIITDIEGDLSSN